MAERVVRFGDRNDQYKAVTDTHQTKLSVGNIPIAIQGSDVEGGINTGDGYPKLLFNGITINIVTNLDTNGSMRIEGHPKFLVGI